MTDGWKKITHHTVKPDKKKRHKSGIRAVHVEKAKKFLLAKDRMR